MSLSIFDNAFDGKHKTTVVAHFIFFCGFSFSTFDALAMFNWFHFLHRTFQHGLFQKKCLFKHLQLWFMNLKYESQIKVVSN